MKAEEFSNLENNGLKKSTQNYEKAAETLAAVIKEVSELNIPEKTIGNWKKLLASIRIVDDRLDHITDPKERLLFRNKIVDFLGAGETAFSDDQVLEDAMLNVYNLSSELSDDQKKFFFSSLSRIMQITEQIKIEEDPRNLVNLTRLEGQTTSKLFIPFLPEEFRKSPNYHKLMQALTRLGRAANSFDSFVDMPTDYSNKQIAVKPHVVNRLLFVGGILSDGLSMLKTTGLSKNLVREFIARTKDTARSYSEKSRN